MLAVDTRLYFLTNLTSCNPVIFDGLSGSINITQKGSLGSKCEAYYHKDIIANILSVSAIRNEGHTLEYENESDSFSLSCSYGQFVFTRRDNGHYVCRRDNGHYVSNLGPSNVFVSTVSDLESKCSTRLLQSTIDNPVWRVSVRGLHFLSLFSVILVGTVL